jgi:hypothetical protein
VIRGALHSGLYDSACESNHGFPVAQRDGRALPRRIFQLQNRRNAFRCYAMTVAGLTISKADFQSAQIRRNHTQEMRSAGVSFSCLGAERRRTPTGYRNARFSRRNSVDVLNKELKKLRIVSSCWWATHERKQHLSNLHDYRPIRNILEGQYLCVSLVFSGARAVWKSCDPTTSGVPILRTFQCASGFSI